MQPLNNASRALEYGLDQIGVAKPLNRLGAALGMAPSVDAAEASQRKSAAAAPTRGSTAGRITGNIIGTLPTAMIPGGVLAQGAASGALLTDKRDARGIAEDALLGAVTAKIGDKAVRGVTRAISPKVAPVVKRLQAAGIPLTPGQIVGAKGGMGGRIVKAAEDRMQGLPGVGDAITAARQRGTDAFRRAAFNEALKPIGKKLPAGVDGHEAIGAVEKELGAAYHAVLPRLTGRVDDQFMADLTNVASEAGTLLPERAAQFSRIMESDVGKNFGPDGSLTGNGLKAIESRLGKRIRTYGTSADPDATDMAALLRQVQGHVRDLAARQNPTEAATLRSVNEGWANFTRLQSAASKAGEGMFSPNQLRAAARVMDSSGRKASSARGDALMQRFAEDAQSVLPSSVPDSGTAGRGTMGLILGGTVGLPAIVGGVAGALPYTRAGGKAAEWLLTGRQGATAQGLSELLRLMAPVGAAGSTALSVDAAR